MRKISTDDASPSNPAATDRNQMLAEQFQSHYQRIYNYIRYRVTTLDEADDLIGVIFERAYTYRDQFDVAKGSFSTWLFRIAHNTLANHYRNRERQAAWQTEVTSSDIAAPIPSLEEVVIQQETISQLLQGLARLPDRDQEIISLKFAGRLRNKEIGEIMNMKEKTVSVALLRAMRRLRQLLEKEAIS